MASIIYKKSMKNMKKEIKNKQRKTQSMQLSSQTLQLNQLIIVADKVCHNIIQM